MKRYVVPALVGQALGLLGWVDPLFIPLVLAGPLVLGAVAAARGVSLTAVVIVLASAGLCLAWTDWVVNREDVGFHLALAVVMPLLGAAGYGAVRLASRGRRAHLPAGEARS